jgi:hypothetical protein
VFGCDASALFGRAWFCSAAGCGTDAVLGCGVVCPAGGRGTLLLGWAALFAVAGRAALALFAVAGRAALASFGRFALFAAGGRVAGTFTVAFLAATTPLP